jgi:beta-lactamase class A
MRPTPRTCTRRQLLSGLAATLAASCTPSQRAPATASSDAALAAIETRAGGRLGAYALDTGTGHALAHRADERFAMCSTFKWVFAAALLARVDQGEFTLGEFLRFSSADLLEYAPVARAHVADGRLSLEGLAEAAVTLSDNTAANLLLGKVGGPAGITRFARAAGDPVTRLDRIEPALNDNDPGDPRDTTSPRAMVGLMRAVLCGGVLSPAGRERLTGWLRACQTGNARLRAGFPADWTAGDKTGTGNRGAVNDVAIAWPPGRAPILVAVYMSDGTAANTALATAHVEVGRMVVRQI